MRTLEEIKKEYLQCCSLMGEKYYLYSAMEQQLYKLKVQIRSLHEEADLIATAEKASKEPTEPTLEKVSQHG